MLLPLTSRWMVLLMCRCCRPWAERRLAASFFFTSTCLHNYPEMTSIKQFSLSSPWGPHEEYKQWWLHPFCPLSSACLWPDLSQSRHCRAATQKTTNCQNWGRDLTRRISRNHSDSQISPTPRSAEAYLSDAAPWERMCINRQKRFRTKSAINLRLTDAQTERIN